jgi:catechol 2,3-dioxygenase-like lactoylglutathione lyase family enzyme
MTSEDFSARPEPGECVAPVLPMRDVEVTARFYERLGFTRQRRYDSGYLVVASGWMELHFFHHPDCDPLTSAAGCFIRVRDVDAVTARFGDHVPPDPRGTPRFLPPTPKPWGMRQAVLVDPDGNLVQFGTPFDQPAHQPTT